MPSIADIHEFIASELQTERFPDDPGGIVRPSEREIERFGLALEPLVGIDQWITSSKIDGLFLHRHWNLDLGSIPNDVGIVACHKPFDAQLTVGSNAPLARELGLSNVVDFGEKDGYPLGMVGEIAPQRFDDFVQRVAQTFGDLEGVAPGKSAMPAKVAVVGGMTEVLVREADSLGCNIYITGEFRVPARAAVEETGIGVVAVGHERGEKWGLRVLSRLIELSLPGLECVTYPAFPAI